MQDGLEHNDEKSIVSVRREFLSGRTWDWREGLSQRYEVRRTMAPIYGVYIKYMTIIQLQVCCDGEHWDMAPNRLTWVR